MSKQPKFVPPPPAAPAVAIGIDVGKSGIHVCGMQPRTHPSKWEVIYLDFKQFPQWWRWLIECCTDETVVALEPTGWAYSAPVTAILQQYTQASIWLVQHHVAAAARAYHLSKHKTDLLDAQALAIIARDILYGEPPQSVRQHNPALEAHVLSLRFNVNAHAKLIASSVRVQNRLRQLGHSMHPSLGRGTVWWSLLQLGVVTPEEIHALEKPAAMHGNRWRHIEALRADLPLIAVPSRVRQSALENFDEWQRIEQRAAELEKEIEAQIEQPPFAEITRRWMTIPAASPIWIAAFHVATHGIADWFTADSFAAALGAFPQKKQSGKKTDDRSAKIGYRPAMNALFQWTLTLTNPAFAPNPVHEYFAGGEKAGGRKFTAARAKFASILSGVARSPEGYIDPYSTRPEEDTQP
jgi:transposase